MKTAIYEEQLHHSGMWSKVIRRGRTLRITDIEGGANVGTLLYNAYEKHERYNMPDTLKGQHIFYLTNPFCIHSDMGRLFASITADTCGWHDTVCGCSNAKTVKEKYGEGNYQEKQNNFHQNGRDCFLIELNKWGLGKRDLVPNLNFFSKVVSDEKGNLSLIENASKAGSYIDLRLEMDTLIVLNLCQHPLDESRVYNPKPVKLEVFEADEVSEEDPCIQSRPENLRAWQNTVNYNTLRF